jgi:hypothetical protein
MDIEQTLSALEMVSEALAAAVSSGSGQVSELLSRRDRLIAHIAGSVPDSPASIAKLQRIRETGQRAREGLKQNRCADLGALDRLRQVSLTRAAQQPDRTLDCIG